VDIVIEEDLERRILDSSSILTHSSVYVFFIHGAVGGDSKFLHLLEDLLDLDSYTEIGRFSSSDSSYCTVYA
jgi:hypothetical protein